MFSIRNLRYLIEYGIVRALIVALRLLPIDMAGKFAGSIAAFVGPRTSLHRRSIVNIEAALPEMSSAEHERILATMWRNTGLIIAETFMLDRVLAEPRRIEIVGGHALEAALAVPGPNIGITPHMGNWELAAMAIAMCGGKLAGVYRPLRNPYLDSYVHAIRQQLYPAGLLFKGTMGGTRKLGETTRNAIDFLRKGGHLGFAADQVEGAASFTVPFFGHDATFSPAPAMFARRLGARIWIGRCLRVGGKSQFRFEYLELEVPRTTEADADIRAMTAAMAAQFETWIRQSPEQWMWWQRRSIGVLPP